MKNFRTVLSLLFLFFVTGYAKAQSATINDFVANWSGTGSDGNSYTLTLRSDNSASLKTNSTALDVTWWKVNCNNGNIIFDAHGHNVLRLISNVNSTSSLSSSGVTTSGGGSPFKTYYADVYYDLKNNKMTMIVDFNNTPGSAAAGSNPVTLSLHK